VRLICDKIVWSKWTWIMKCVTKSLYAHSPSLMNPPCPSCNQRKFQLGNHHLLGLFLIAFHRKNRHSKYERWHASSLLPFSSQYFHS
jgi:hypothetical protein